MVRAPHLQQALDGDPLLKSLFRSDSASSTLQEKSESANQSLSPLSFQDMEGALSVAGSTALTSQPRVFNSDPAPSLSRPPQSSSGFTFSDSTQFTRFSSSSPSPSSGPAETLISTFGGPGQSSSFSFGSPSPSGGFSSGFGYPTTTPFGRPTLTPALNASPSPSSSLSFTPFSSLNTFSFGSPTMNDTSPTTGENSVGVRELITYLDNVM